MAGLTPGHFEKDNFNIHSLGPGGCDRVPPSWKPRRIEGPVDQCCSGPPSPGAKPGGSMRFRMPRLMGKPLEEFNGAALLVVLALIVAFFFYPRR